MTASDYTRQYQLYSMAILRWLRRIHGDDSAAEARLGGAFYVFLRGLNGNDNSPGVFFTRPTAEELTLQTVLGE